MSGYICNDTLQWEELMNNAKYEWEEIDITSTQADSINRLRRMSKMVDSVGHVKVISEAAGTYKLVRKLVARNANGTVALKADGTLDYIDKDGINGHDLILSKLAMVREWLKTEYGISIDEMRSEVQGRTYVRYADGTFPITQGRLVNRITSPTKSDPSKSVIDSLLYQIDRFEPLMEK
jgi:hypothetical protein